MKKAVLSLLVAVVILTAGAPGIRPRADAESYPGKMTPLVTNIDANREPAQTLFLLR